MNHKVFPSAEFEAIYKKNANQYLHPLIFTRFLSHQVIPEVGILNHIQLGKALVQLGDPICKPGNYEMAFTSFIEEAKKRNCYPIFFLVSENFARFCSEKGYLCNSMGPTAYLDLHNYHWSGKINRNANAVLKQGIKVRCVQIDSHQNSDYIRLQEFNKIWLSSQKQKKELQLAVGRLDEIILKEHLIFIAEDDSKIHGFISTHPYYSDNNIQGYFLDIIRRNPDSFKRGVIELLIRTSFELFKERGINEYSLGWMPLCLETSELFLHSKKVRSLSEKIFNYGNFLYSFKNVAASKQHYHPYYKGNYVSFPKSLFTLLYTYKIFKKINFSFYPFHWAKSWLKNNKA